MSFKVRGVGSTISKKLVDNTASEDVDKIAQTSIHRLGGRASERAPVDTGLLSGTMISGIHKNYGESSAHKSAWELLQRTEYTLVQEFEHKSKDRFIRDSAIEERPNFRKDLEDRFKKRGGSS